MLTPHVLWALRNGDPLEPSQRRIARHLGFWVLFAYMEKWTYSLIAPELVITALVTAIVCALFAPLRANTSFLAMHAALIVSLGMTAWGAPDAPPVVDLFLLVVLVIAYLMSGSRVVLASLLLLHALMLFVDPWSVPSSTLTSAHFVARALAVVMVLSMLFIRRPAPRVVEAPLVHVPATSPLSAVEWDRKKR
jgi:hypothetical protein